jgi:Ca-activated chloride channel family protein
MKGRPPSNRFCYLSCLAAAFVALFVISRDSRPQGTPATLFWSNSRNNVIRVNTSLVTVPLSVTDAAGRSVSSLTIKDFHIEDDDNPEVIVKLAEPGQSSLQLVLLLDTSGSVNPRFDFEMQAAARFLEKIRKSGDTVSLIAFNLQPHLLLRNSTSVPEMQQALAQLKPTEGATAFYDSIVLGAHTLRVSADPEMRRSQIVLSDGEDNNSENYSFKETLREVQRSDCVLYSINPGGNSIRLNEVSLKGQQTLSTLAAETGGTAFVSNDANDLDTIFEKIAYELRTQYLLSYYPQNARNDGAFHKIKVSIPSQPELHVRARRGYYAAHR